MTGLINRRKNEMSDYIPTDEELEKSFATLPKIG